MKDNLARIECQYSEQSFCAGSIVQCFDRPQANLTKMYCRGWFQDVVRLKGWLRSEGSLPPAAKRNADRRFLSQRAVIVAPHSSGLTSRTCLEKSQWWPSR